MTQNNYNNSPIQFPRPHRERVSQVVTLLEGTDQVEVLWELRHILQQHRDEKAKRDLRYALSRAEGNRYPF